MNSTRPELSYDGKGINGPDEYRARIATFDNAQAAKAYGPLFAAAPELLVACQEAFDELAVIRQAFDVMDYGHASDAQMDRIAAALAKAKGE